METEFNATKWLQLRDVNTRLNITNNKIVFVYTAPKVGSTSVVSSLRIFGTNCVDIIHIHDEIMLNVLSGISGVTINEIINYNRHIGKQVYVINVYRSPIERKISAFFEKIGSYHFNNNDTQVNEYNVDKVINRFNKIFPHIALGDHFIDKYNINVPDVFDYKNKVLIINDNNVKYISLRLKDSMIWGSILTNIMGFTIRIKKDYESSNKPIKDLYNRFKLNYYIPINLLNDVMNDKYLKYYYSPEEITDYYNRWLLQSTNNEFVSYNHEQYALYEELSIENSHLDYVQSDHYFDEGCVCKACNIKRKGVAMRLIKGEDVNDRIIHIEAKNELIKKRITIINNLPLTNKKRGKDFTKDMNSILLKPR
jgi:hypothetical protein